MYRFVRSNDKRYSENSKDSIAALELEQEVIDYMNNLEEMYP